MRFRVGQIVAVTFLDHAEGPVAYEFVVWGRVSNVTRQAVTVRSWDYASKIGDGEDYNVAEHTIVRKTITKAVELRERKA